MISLFHLIEVFEGPPAITTCMTKGPKLCQIDSSCPQKSSWHMVHKKIARVLQDISLEDLFINQKSPESMTKRVVRHV
jgi:DNA-binding IscR family transcriptional regulator